MVVTTFSHVKLVLELDVDTTVPRDDYNLEVEDAENGLEKEGVTNGDWKLDGKEWPLVKDIEKKLFTMETYIAALERNFSTMGFIHTKLRNRLSPVSVENLVYVKTIWACSTNLHKIKLGFLHPCYPGPKYGINNPEKLPNIH